MNWTFHWTFHWTFYAMFITEWPNELNISLYTSLNICWTFSASISCNYFGAKFGVFNWRHWKSPVYRINVQCLFSWVANWTEHTTEQSFSPNIFDSDQTFTSNVEWLNKVVKWTGFFTELQCLNFSSFDQGLRIKICIPYQSVIKHKKQIQKFNTPHLIVFLNNPYNHPADLDQWSLANSVEKMRKTHSLQLQWELLIAPNRGGGDSCNFGTRMCRPYR